MGLFGCLALFELAYDLALAVYGLRLYPLVSHPGSEVAASTYWYEAYHDVFKGHQYVWKIQEMHR